MGKKHWQYQQQWSTISPTTYMCSVALHITSVVGSRQKQNNETKKVRPVYV